MINTIITGDTLTAGRTTAIYADYITLELYFHEMRPEKPSHSHFHYCAAALLFWVFRFSHDRNISHANYFHKTLLYEPRTCTFTNCIYYHKYRCTATKKFVNTWTREWEWEKKLGRREESDEVLKFPKLSKFLLGKLCIHGIASHVQSRAQALLLVSRKWKRYMIIIAKVQACTTNFKSRPSMPLDWSHTRTRNDSSLSSICVGDCFRKKTKRVQIN